MMFLNGVRLYFSHSHLDVLADASSPKDEAQCHGPAHKSCPCSPTYLDRGYRLHQLSATGNRLQIIGVAYQPGGSSGYDPRNGIDPLSDGAECLRDAAMMQRLGINTIRVYNANPDLNHDLCVSIFNTVGIYMLLDVNSPMIGESINREEAWTTYTTAYLNSVRT
jgi:hypothetical protein